MKRLLFVLTSLFFFENLASAANPNIGLGIFANGVEIPINESSFPYHNNEETWRGVFYYPGKGDAAMGRRPGYEGGAWFEHPQHGQMEREIQLRIDNREPGKRYKVLVSQEYAVYLSRGINKCEVRMRMFHNSSELAEESEKTYTVPGWAGNEKISLEHVIEPSDSTHFSINFRVINTGSFTFMPFKVCVLEYM